MKKLFLLLALLGMVATGCSKDEVDKGNDNKTEQPNEDEGGNENDDDEKPVFEIDAEGSYTIPAEGAEIEVTITTNLEYRVEVSEDAKAWLSIGDTRAVRTETLIFTVAKNESNRERTATITIFNKDDEKVFEFRLTQKFNDKADIPENIFFGLDKESATISPDGGSVDVIVYSNYKWEISGTSDWCTPSVKGGDANENGQKVTFSADVAYDDREATFWFHCADKQIKFVVSQKFKEVIIPDANNTFNIPAKGGVAVISYQTNIDCEVIIPEEAQDWITIAPSTRGLSTYSTTLNIAENNSGKERSCVIKVTSQGDNELSAEYTITQRPRYCLYYTSSNGGIVQPNNSSSFGATIISNTYKDGVGVIDFNTPITTIGEWAFGDCDSLTSVTIPDSVTEIGESAFYGCDSLTSVSIPDSVMEIGYMAFGWCVSLTSVTIPDSVTTIGEYAFYNCSSLTSVTIPDSVTMIGRSAFSGCDSLTSVTIPDSVTTIGEYAFYNCSSLTSVTIPDSVTTIGESAFAGCTGELIIYSKIIETDYSFDNRPTDGGWLNGAKFTKLTMGDGIEKIGDYAFWNCSSLTSVTIGDSVTTIGDYAFYWCESLTSVTIGDCVTTIGNSAFEECSSLTGVTIPDSVTTIGDDAFHGCSSLTSVTIPDSVTTIGNDAFAYCESLTSVTIPDSVTTIGEGAFYYCSSLTSVTIGDSVTTIGGWAFNSCSSLTSVTIPDSVTTIGDAAFRNCSSLTSVTIPDSVTEIGYAAFCWCGSLTSVTIPDSVTEIGYDAFRNCSSLTSVYCKPTTPPEALLRYGLWDAFDDNASGRKIYVPTESVLAYKRASYWSSYKSYIFGYNF